MIPATAHFIWYSAAFHWLHAAAIRSAVRRGGFERVVLHHDTNLESRPAWRTLEDLKTLETRPIVASDVFARCGAMAESLAEVYETLTAPAARANVLRAAILYAEGGVYLDTDTVTVAELTPLRSAGSVFVGLEHVVYPRSLMATKRPLRFAGALALDGVRDLTRRLPDGWRTFRRLEHLYTRAANNAVIGAEPGARFLGSLLDGMVSMPVDRRGVRFSLGTHLLQETVAKYADDASLKCLPPEVFYPLGPEISEHWFRPARRLALEEMLSAETRVVHWYASVRTAARVPHIDAEWVGANADRIPLAALLREYAGEQP